MTLQEIETALGTRLTGISPAPRIAWPNKDAAPALPYLEFRHVPVSIEDITLDNTGKRQLGLVLVTVVTQKDKFTTEANGLVAAVQARFLRSSRITAGAGAIVVTKHPEPVAPFQDGVYWRQPVRITYETEE